MLKNLSSKARLISLNVFFIVMILALGLIGLKCVNDSNVTLNNVYLDQPAPVNQLAAISDLTSDIVAELQQAGKQKI